MIRIPPAIDLTLRDQAELIAGPDTVLTDAMQWTRADYIDAIHAILRCKWREGAISA